MKKGLILLIAVFVWAASYAASIDTTIIFSNCMKKAIKCVVIKPESYNLKQHFFPVVYLLHGYGDRYDAWITKVPAIKDYADQMQMMIVCPDGGFSSGYFDSPIQVTYKYDTYISSEVVKYIDSHYHTIPDRSHRAIAGLSMGGHGSLYLALRHPDVFGAAGSMSGGVDLRPFPDEWDIAKRIGNAGTNAANWQNMSVLNMIGQEKSRSVAMMIECGTDDFFYQVNLQLHQKMMKLKIAHDYIERPGAHNWKYWGNAIEYQLLFFKKQFNNQRK